MPKIIKDIEAKILRSAIELLKEKGYENVDMRLVAKANGIAVGTLYNYFSNKEELFLSALEESWSDTIEILDTIVESEETPDNKLTKFIETLYDGMVGRGGLGRQLILNDIVSTSKKRDKDNMKNSPTLTGLENIGDHLADKLEVILRDLRTQNDVDVEEDMIQRMGHSLIILTGTTLGRFPNEREKNIAFLKRILNT